MPVDLSSDAVREATMMTDRFTVTDPPHLASGETVPRAMMDVLIALIPVTLVSVWFFRLNAVFLIAVCTATAVLADLAVRRFRGGKSVPVDGSAVVTGVLVALLFGPLTGWWIGMLATILAVVVAKELGGGLGLNRFNPAAFGRVAVILLAPVTVFLNQHLAAVRVLFPMAGEVSDAVTGATPLALLKQGMLDVEHLRLLIGYPGGALAETSALALLVGGAYLIYRQHITWHVPASMIATVAVLTTVLGHDPVKHVLTGGLLLGAFFMATDWVTSPITDTGRIMSGIGIGVLVVVFRIGLGPTEGVAFSILIMNAFVPIIDQLTRRKVFGQRALTETA